MSCLQPPTGENLAWYNFRMQKSLAFSSVFLLATIAFFPAAAFACGGTTGKYPQLIPLLILPLGALIHAVVKIYSFRKSNSLGVQELKYVRNISAVLLVGSVPLILYVILLNGTMCIPSPEEAYVDAAVSGGVLKVFLASLFSTVYSMVILFRKTSAVRKSLVFLALTLLVIIEIIILLTLLKLTLFFPGQFPSQSIEIPY